MYFRVFLIVASVIVITASPVRSSELIPRAALVEMASGQFNVLCNSEAFTSCMGFSQSECKRLSDSAIQQCLLPLPEQIDPTKLDNASLESCPKDVFAEAGYSEEKAGMCFDEALESGEN